MLAVVSATGHAAILVRIGASDDVTEEVVEVVEIVELVEVVNVKFPDVADTDELLVEIAA